MDYLRLDNVCHIFSNKESSFSLKNISFTIDSPGLISIIGKSGSGKSTIGNIISGLLKPNKGEVYFNNQNIYSKNDKKLSRFRNENIGFIFQHYNLLEEETILNNVIIPFLINHKNKKYAIREAKILLNNLNFKDDDFNKKVSILSGGEKQRVAFARALINNPEIVLADEPTGALDEKNALIIMKALKTISKNRIVILISHNLKLVKEYSDRIIEIVDGQIHNDICISKYSYPLKQKENKKVEQTTFSFDFANRNYKKHVKKHIFSFLALSFSLISFINIFGFNYQQENRIMVSSLQSIDYSVSTIAFKNEYKIEGSDLSLIKLSRLEDDEIRYIIPSSFLVEQNINYFIPTNMPFKNETDDIENIKFAPILSYNRNINIIKGSLPNNSINEILINESCYQYLNDIYKNDVLGKKIKASYSVEVINYFNEASIKDTFFFEQDLLIKGITSDFEFLNSNKIYYSYNAYKDYLKNYNLLNLSKKIGKDYTYYDLIKNSANNDKVTSYSNFLFYLGNDKNDFINEYRNLKNISYVNLENDSYSASEAFLSLNETAKTCLTIFSIISLFGTICLLILVTTSSFLQDKKEITILRALGCEKERISSSYVIEAFSSSLLALFFSLIASYFVQLIINKIMYSKFKITDFISIPLLEFKGIKFLLPIILLLGVSLITLISAYIPILFKGNFNLSKELKDE